MMVQSNSSEVFVVDASIAVKWLLPEPGRAAALALLDLSRAGRVELIAPALILMEVANVLAKRCRQKYFDQSKADQLFTAFESNAPAIVELPNQSRLAFMLSLERHISLWDSVYLALALGRDAKLLTADERFYRAVSRYYPLATLVR